MELVDLVPLITTSISFQQHQVFVTVKNGVSVSSLGDADGSTVSVSVAVSSDHSRLEETATS